MPKAIWGFNGTERPGAVYLASALAGHNQKGLPTFGIYGRDVQDLTDGSIPDDVREKLLRFGRAAVAVMQMRGKSYLSIGSVSMGIAGSTPNPDFFQEYLGMRNEFVDCSEIERRIELGIYDKDEFDRAMEWVRKYCMSRGRCGLQSRAFAVWPQPEGRYLGLRGQDDPDFPGPDAGQSETCRDGIRRGGHGA